MKFAQTVVRLGIPPATPAWLQSVIRLEAMTEEGGVTMLLTVKLTAAEVVLLPAASRATAVKVCAPLPRERVFKEEVGRESAALTRLHPCMCAEVPLQKARQTSPATSRRQPCPETFHASFDPKVGVQHGSGRF